VVRWTRTRTQMRAALSRAKEQGEPLVVVADALRRAMRLVKPKKEREAWESIDQVRQALLRRTDFIEEIDYGAGLSGQQCSPEKQRSGVIIRNRVNETTSYSKERHWVEILFYLARARRPRKVLEMGTCVGISGSYIAKALQLNGNGRLWTLEGSPASAALARETFAKVGVAEWVVLLVGPFHQTLMPCLANSGPFDFVFVDGHHDGQATIGYFEQIENRLAPEAIVVFDDITWSSDMARAWTAISSRGLVRGRLPLRGMGILVTH
jgi:predicted O-methyltransferase YrrM